MKKLKVVTLLSLAALLVAPVSFARDGASNPNHVPGESIDSGLGELSAKYTGSEFMHPNHIPGESIDSGLGELAANYTGSEYMHPNHIPGEKIDSGLGDLPPTYTGAEFMKRDVQVAGDESPSESIDDIGLLNAEEAAI